MRGKLISAIIVLAVVLALCHGAARIVWDATATMRNLAIRAAAAAERGDHAEAEKRVAALMIALDERRLALEVLVAHDDINQVEALAAEARVQLRHGDDAAFAGSMALIAEALTVLDERQMLTVGNLF